MPANQLVACFPTLPSPKSLCHLLSHLLKLSTNHSGTLSTKHIKGCFSVLVCRYYYFSCEAGCMPWDSATHYAGGKEVLGRTLQMNAYIFRAFRWWHHLGCYMGLYSFLPGRHNITMSAISLTVSLLSYLLIRAYFNALVWTQFRSYL